jgi:hypothetical protein
VLAKAAPLMTVLLEDQLHGSFHCSHMKNTANSQTLVTGLNEHWVDQPDLFVCGMKNQECSFCC